MVFSLFLNQFFWTYITLAIAAKRHKMIVFRYMTFQCVGKIKLPEFS